MMKRSGAGRYAVRSAMSANDSRNQMLRFSLCPSCLVASLEFITASCWSRSNYRAGFWVWDKVFEDFFGTAPKAQRDSLNRIEHNFIDPPLSCRLLGRATGLAQKPAGQRGVG